MMTYNIDHTEFASEDQMMISFKYAKRAFRKFLAVGVIILLATLLIAQASFAAKQRTFPSAEEAVQAFITAQTNNDSKELVAIFGPSASKLIFSGDEVSDKERREGFLKLYGEQNRLVPKNGDMILQVGPEDYPFPIPLVKKGGTWYFDTAKGQEEILNRRIGSNELSTIQAMLAIVDAQREYAQQDHDGDGLLAYAAKIASDPGEKNGLYWETKQGEEPSPLGELMVKARAEGYRKGKAGKPVPYHGYYFRILSKQGKNAEGGAFDYFEKGRMIGGFAVVAYPATYGNSGVMTFIVNHDGVVYQKNLGPRTAKIAMAMKAFDPGPGWEKVDVGGTK